MPRMPLRPHPLLQASATLAALGLAFDPAVTGTGIIRSLLP